MKRIIGAILCLTVLPVMAEDRKKKFAESTPQKTEATKAEEPRRRNAVRRSTFIYVAPRESWGSIAGWVAGSITREVIESRRAARVERLYQQQERIEQGFSNPYTSRPVGETFSTPSNPVVQLPPIKAPEPVAVAAAPTPKPAPRETQPGEFRPKIVGLE